MNKSKLLASALVAVTFLLSGTAHAHEDLTNTEKCKVVNAKGEVAILENKADSPVNNKAGDQDAWIFVPKGMCDKINKGDFTDVPENIKAKIDMNMMTTGQ